MYSLPDSHTLAFKSQFSASEPLILERISLSNIVKLLLPECHGFFRVNLPALALPTVSLTVRATLGFITPLEWPHHSPL